MDKSIRWRQGFQNFQNAFGTLEFGVSVEKPNILEQQGIIHIFEFTFELSWKTLKDFLESKEVMVSYPRDVIKQAFQHEILEDGELWMEMLEQRNLMSHTYNEELAELALQKIKSSYFPAISQLVNFLANEQ